ncbi:uncharacterized protein LOC132046096 [Lycium ferocissimum]|uniref:uncharacterized protein LOC132046096 n=1 Tax=Lycium ferocissimum TaxID=112874 RepID=UPI00281613BB|nr:uncharacterized protein LOC132046096 [Lycium ferocissimum]
MGLVIPSKEKKNILIAVDYVSKWVEAIPLPTNDANVVEKEHFTRFGTPRAIISDEGTHLKNKLLNNLLAKYRVRHKVVTGYQPQTSVRTSYETPILTSPIRLVFGKACHLPFELANKAYWEIKKLNLYMDATGEKRMLQSYDLDEFHFNAYENAKLYKERTNRWHDKHIQHYGFELGQLVLLYNSRLRLF